MFKPLTTTLLTLTLSTGVFASTTPLKNGAPTENKPVTAKHASASRAAWGQVFTSFPDKINPEYKYVIYAHGYIVEGTNPKPVHPEWGIYDFPADKQALVDYGVNVIAYHRPAKSNPRVFAKKQANDVQKLIDAGVPESNIYLAGFSRGGAITILTSNELKLNNINVIILAGCSGFVMNNNDVQVYGHVHSIFETSDQVGSCQFLIDRSKKVTSFNEISISTGKSHGAFYRPIAEWVTPVKNWINGTGKL